MVSRPISPSKGGKGGWLRLKVPVKRASRSGCVRLPDLAAAAFPQCFNEEPPQYHGSVQLKLSDIQELMGTLRLLCLWERRGLGRNFRIWVQNVRKNRR